MLSTRITDIKNNISTFTNKIKKECGFASVQSAHHALLTRLDSYLKLNIETAVSDKINADNEQIEVLFELMCDNRIDINNKFAEFMKFMTELRFIECLYHMLGEYHVLA